MEKEEGAAEQQGRARAWAEQQRLEAVFCTREGEELFLLELCRSGEEVVFIDGSFSQKSCFFSVTRRGGRREEGEEGGEEGGETRDSGTTTHTPRERQRERDDDDEARCAGPLRGAVHRVPVR